LQAPDGVVQRGSTRTFTDNKAVAHLKKSLVAGKECQANLMNYRKGGHPFLNLVSIIPISWDNPDEIQYHVGFQVDLVHQPNAILQTMRDGTYLVNYSTANPPSLGLHPPGYPPHRDRDRMPNSLTSTQRHLLNKVTEGEESNVNSEEPTSQNFNRMILNHIDGGS
jgi:hypothetical protein